MINLINLIMDHLNLVVNYKREDLKIQNFLVKTKDIFIMIIAKLKYFILAEALLEYIPLSHKTV